MTKTEYGRIGYLVEDLKGKWCITKAWQSKNGFYLVSAKIGWAPDREWDPHYLLANKPPVV
jgi:hypothetical protein